MVESLEAAQAQVPGAARKALSGNKAVAMAVRDLDVDVVAAYPITPQTTMVEAISELIAQGELDAEIIHVESEHSAISAAAGATAVGARSFTATSSQGLALMHEVLHIVSGLRMPTVMAVAMRALSAPISIWNDHSDVMNARDTGWVIYLVSSAQEAYDTLVMAYRIAEDPDVRLPVMVAYDGYVTSHTTEPVVVEGRERVLSFAPKRVTWDKLDPENPITIGTLASPEYYYEIKYQQHRAMLNALETARRVEEEFSRVFHRRYGLVQSYRAEDAQVVLLVTASYWDNARVAVEKARGEGVKAGLVKLRLYRPLPVEELAHALGSAGVVGVVDRAISWGLPNAGPLYNEVSTALRDRVGARFQSIVAGIGQRTMLVEDFVKLFKLLDERMRGGRYSEETLFYGVRGA